MVLEIKAGVIGHEVGKTSKDVSVGRIHGPEQEAGKLMTCVGKAWRLGLEDAEVKGSGGIPVKPDILVKVSAKLKSCLESMFAMN